MGTSIGPLRCQRTTSAAQICNIGSPSEQPHEGERAPKAAIGRRPSPEAHAGEGRYFTVDPDTGCWVWAGNRQTYPNGKQYGRIGFQGRNYRAHRVFYVAFRGPIPTGLALDHLCANPLCVNPNHLEPVSIGENVRRGRLCKLTPNDVGQIRQLLDHGGLTQQEIGRLFGVSHAAVNRISQGVSWYEDARGKSVDAMPIPAALIARVLTGGAA